MFKWLYQPIPFQAGLLRQIKSNLLGGAVIFLVLYLMRPFGTNVPEGQEMKFVVLCLAYGGITFFAATLYHTIASFFGKNVDESKWVVWKNILQTLGLISFIGVANWLFSMYYYDLPLSWSAFLGWQYMTFVIGIIPTLLGYFLYQQRLLKKYSGAAQVLNEDLQKQSLNPSFEEIWITGENQNEELLLKTNELLFIESANNYVEIFYKKNGSLEKSLMRSTLKKIEKQLAAHEQFFRCHRTYLVNQNLVEKISGNAQGYKLHLKETDIQIPVSRSLNESVSKRFSKEK